MSDLNTSLSIQQLTDRGGKVWAAGECHRVYFDAFDLVATKNPRNSGAIVFAGRDLSGTKSQAIARCLRDSKVWVDVKTGEVGVKAVGCNALGRDSEAPAMQSLLIEAIEAKLS